MEKIKGQVWIFGDNVDTDQILPGYAMAESFENLGNFAMCGSNIPDFAKKVQKGDIIVAGKNFGCGSSREQAPVALLNSGVSLIIAESFARIFRRNAINIGLAVMTGDVTSKVKHGETINVSVDEGILNETIELNKLSESVLETLNAGGLINRVRKELKEGSKLA